LLGVQEFGERFAAHSSGNPTPSTTSTPQTGQVDLWRGPSQHSRGK
jgi:hypothetical protein